MALAKVLSCAVVGLDGELIEVEVDIARGMPAFAIVGLPDAAVQEAKERVRSAIRNSGFPFPSQRITVNLAPADLKKGGAATCQVPISRIMITASKRGGTRSARSPEHFRTGSSSEHMRGGSARRRRRSRGVAAPAPRPDERDRGASRPQQLDESLKALDTSTRRRRTR